MTDERQRQKPKILLARVPDHFEIASKLRLKILKFSTQCLVGPGSQWLCRIANAEDHPLTVPDAERCLRMARNNLRQALTQLETDMSG